MGCELALFREDRIPELQIPLLRLSDPALLRATRLLREKGIRYIGPDADVMARCYDKSMAYQRAAAAGFDCPGPGKAFPMIAKPRLGSDSIGLRLCGSEDERQKLEDNDYLVQERLLGIELTVGILDGRAGTPLRIELPEGTPYTFLRKYLAPPRKAAVSEELLADRVRGNALGLAKLFRVDWAARVDFIYVPRTGRLCFIECDVAPLIGERSAFAESLRRAGIARAEQLRLLSRRTSP